MVIGHAILCCAAGYGLVRTAIESPWDASAFGVLFSYGAVGVSNNYVENENLAKAEEYILLISEIIPLAFLNTFFYLKSSMRPEIAYVHAASAAIPLTTEAATRERNENLIDVVIIGNITTLSFLAFQQNNIWYGLLAICAALNRFGSRKIAEQLELPEKDAVALCLGIFTLVGIRCVYGSF